METAGDALDIQFGRITWPDSEITLYIITLYYKLAVKYTVHLFPKISFLGTHIQKNKDIYPHNSSTKQNLLIFVE